MTWRWEPAVAAVALVAAVAAFVITLDAHFLQYPDWLAVQKADLILGPIGVGLYWHLRRPGNRLGVLLVVLGLLGVLYLFESTASPTSFTLGTLTEYIIEPVTVACILAFPSGRLDGPVERVILVVAFFGIPLAGLLFLLIAPQFTPAYSLSGCRTLCPPNPFAIPALASWSAPVTDAARATVIAVYFGTAGLMIWRFVSGTPPRRRSLIIGGPVALCFLLTLGLYQSLSLIDPSYAAANAEPLVGAIGWVSAATRSLLWYGFLFALIAAELYAGRVLRRLNRDSLGRPTFRELEGMLRGPLGDPGLRLGFWRRESSEWVDAEGAQLTRPGPGQHATEIDRDGRAVIAIVHDRQLSDDPELLQAAGAVVLMALENSELDAAWKESLRELRGSRARLASAGERERRKLERDLHDGAQQHLVAASINLTLAEEAGDERERHERIADSRSEIEQALIELRETSHGIYPTALARAGLGRAFDWLAGRYPRVTVKPAVAERFSPEVELAVYYCGLEAVQNASKHAGPEARIWVGLDVKADQLHLEVRDDGRGFDVGRVTEGVGLQNMRDRLGAVGGHLDVVSEPAKGTLVAAWAPVSSARQDRAAEPGNTLQPGAPAHLT